MATIQTVAVAHSGVMAASNPAGVRINTAPTRMSRSIDTPRMNILTAPPS